MDREKIGIAGEVRELPPAFFSKCEVAPVKVCTCLVLAFIPTIDSGSEQVQCSAIAVKVCGPNKNEM